MSVNDSYFTKKKISKCGYQYQDDVLDVRGLQVSICWIVFSWRFASNIYQSRRGVHSVHLTTLSHVILQVLRRESCELKDHRWKIWWQNSKHKFRIISLQKKKEFYTDSRSHSEVGDIGKWRHKKFCNSKCPASSRYKPSSWLQLQQRLIHRLNRMTSNIRHSLSLKPNKDSSSSLENAWTKCL